MPSIRFSALFLWFLSREDSPSPSGLTDPSDVDGDHLVIFCKDPSLKPRPTPHTALGPALLLLLPQQPPSSIDEHPVLPGAQASRTLSHSTSSRRQMPGSKPKRPQKTESPTAASEPPTSTSLPARNIAVLSKLCLATQPGNAEGQRDDVCNHHSNN